MEKCLDFDQLFSDPMDNRIRMNEEAEEEAIYHTLKHFGIKSNNRTYDFIHDAVLICMEYPEYITSIREKVYDLIAGCGRWKHPKKYIRKVTENALMKAYEGLDADDKLLIYGNEVDPAKGPTPSQSITCMTRYANVIYNYLKKGESYDKSNDFLHRIYFN